MRCPICDAEVILTPLDEEAIKMVRKKGFQATHRADCPNHPYCPFSGELVSNAKTFTQTLRSDGRYSLKAPIPKEVLVEMGLELGDIVQVTIRRIEE